jgi:hypothetical protein
LTEFQSYGLLVGQTVAGTSPAGDGPIISTYVPLHTGMVQAEISGSPTACVINVMGALPGSSTFGLLAVLDISSGYVSGNIVKLDNLGINRIKGNLQTLTGGTNPSVNLWFTGRG